MKTPKRITHWLLDHPIIISVVAFLLLSVTLICLDVTFLKRDVENSITNLLVEAHGLLFDLLLFGIILAAVSILAEKRQKIERYKEEIDDYRRWDEKEATYRIVGNVRRLNRLKVTNIDLSFCFLQDAKLENVNLENANLFLAQLQRANLNKACLDNADLQAAQLQASDLGEASLRNANLCFAKLQGAKIYDADLRDANLDKANLQGAELKREYSDSPYWIVDENNKIVGPEGAKFWTVRANLCGASLRQAIAFENQQEDLIQAGADIEHVQFVRLVTGDVENAQKIESKPPNKSFEPETFRFRFFKHASALVKFFSKSFTVR